jgi:ATP synthase protein I
MSPSDPSHGDPLRSLEDRADALERRTARPVPGAGNRAVDQAYKIIAELLGGAIVGLALGFGVDRLTGRTAPWGLIGGVLLGFAVSIWMAKRTADRLTAQATSEAAPAAPAVVRTQDEDEV